MLDYLKNVRKMSQFEKYTLAECTCRVHYSRRTAHPSQPSKQAYSNCVFVSFIVNMDQFMVDKSNHDTSHNFPKISYLLCAMLNISTTAHDDIFQMGQIILYHDALEGYTIVKLSTWIAYFFEINVAKIHVLTKATTVNHCDYYLHFYKYD